MSFPSDGFDLDALPTAGSGSGEDVIFEVGGGATIADKHHDEPPMTNDVEASPVGKSEELKAQGNEAFKAKNFLEAYDMYTAAIEACPGMKGSEIVALRDAFNESEREKQYEIHRLKHERHETAEWRDQQDEQAPQEPAEFKAPTHAYGTQLSIYHCNRAACNLHLEKYEEAIDDCDVAILLRPEWGKAYSRRSQASEKINRTDDALADAKKALTLEPTNASLRSTVARLQKMENERLEKLKEETMGQLKDLGNSLLSNFGLSLDNFQAKQDPTTGSYSISFNQNPS